jgi:SAM-dependent methyltransferase
MRYAEFDVVLRQLELRDRLAVLDVGSPQWLSLVLASRHPNVAFHYVNIVDSEREPFREIAEALELRNLQYHKGDVRDLDFAAATFDKVVSVSVIEHVHPEDGGDVRALRELERVLRAGGEVLLTVPYKAAANGVYVDGPVSVRDGKERNFFAREYDRTTFDRMIGASGLCSLDAWFICEREGLFAVDYHEWGPGRGRLVARILSRVRKLTERRFGVSLDGMLAKRYLRVSQQASARLVNIAAKLAKSP